MKYSFENLDVWNDSIHLVKLVYDFTKHLPDDEKFCLTNQIRRAVISVSSNIAEGSSRLSTKDQSHFYQIAYSSLVEVLSQLIICKELDYINSEKYLDIRSQIEKVSYKVNALRKSRLNNV